MGVPLGAFDAISLNFLKFFLTIVAIILNEVINLDHLSGVRNKVSPNPDINPTMGEAQGFARADLTVNQALCNGLVAHFIPKPDSAYIRFFDLPLTRASEKLLCVRVSSSAGVSTTVIARGFCDKSLMDACRQIVIEMPYLKKFPRFLIQFPDGKFLSQPNPSRQSTAFV